MNTLSSHPEINVGVDTGKKQLDIYIRPLAFFFRVENNPAVVKTAIERLKQHQPSRILIEPTGRFETLFVEACLEAELPIRIVNPLLVRRFAAATGRLAKTDRIDAEIIAFYGEAIKPRLTATKSKQLELVSDLLSRRRQLKTMATMEKKRLASMPTAFHKDIQQLLKTIEKQVERIDAQLDQLIEKMPAWASAECIVTKHPGCGQNPRLYATG